MDRLSAGAHDAVRARPQIARDDDVAARTKIGSVQQVPDHCFDIDVGL
jgi:hypothetical protein